MAKTKKKYVVFLESSGFYGSPVAKPVMDFIARYVPNENYKMLYIVPEMALFEAQKHVWSDFVGRLNAFESAIKQLGDIPFVGNAKLDPLKGKYKKTKEEVKSWVIAEIGKLGIQVVATPTIKMDWNDVFNRAAFRKFPFEAGDKEKGFKDMMIAQTLILNLPELTAQGEVVFICKDGVLQQYVKEMIGEIENFMIYPSIVDFDSALRLREVTSGSKAIEEIADEAERAFYNENDVEHSLFFTGGVAAKIAEKYPSILAKPKFEMNFNYLLSQVTFGSNSRDSWLPISGPEYGVGKPIFIRQESPVEYVWTSTVVYQQQFGPPSGYSVWKTAHSSALDFKVTWTSKFGSDGTIDRTSCKIIDIEYIPSSNKYFTPVLSDFESNPSELTPNYVSGASGYPIGLTGEGQGTTPVGPSYNPSRSLSESYSVSPSPSPSLSEQYEVGDR